MLISQFHFFVSRERDKAALPMLAEVILLAQGRPGVRNFTFP